MAKRNYGRYWALLKELNKISSLESKEMVYNWTDGRTDSLKDLSDKEYQELIEHLENQLPEPQKKDAQVQRMRSKILHLATRKMGMCHNGNPNDVDWTKFNRFMKTKSYLKKQLNAYKTEELPKLVSQFERIANS